MDKIQIKKFFFLLFLVSATGLHAQLTFNSADEAIQYALKNNRGNITQQLKAEQAKSNLTTTKAFLYPNINGGFNGQYNIDIAETPVPGELLGQPGQTVYMKFGKEYTYNAGVNVSYNILNWTAIYQSKTAKANLTLADINSRYYEQKLREQVGQTYYAVLTATQAELLCKQNLDVADTIEMLTHEKMEEGLVDQLAMNQATINKIAVEQQLERTKLYHIQIEQQLKMLLGIEISKEIKLTETVSKEKTETENFHLTPDLYANVLKQQGNVADSEIKTAIGAFLPQVSLKGYFGANQFWNDFDFSFASNDWRKSNYVGLSVSIPIFNGFSNKSRYEAAKIQKQIAEKAYNEEVSNSQFRDNQLLKEYLTDINVANSSLEKMKLADENKQLALQKYEHGLIGLSDYLEIFSASLNAQNQYLNDISQLRSTQSTIHSRM